MKELGRLESINVRDYWKNEASHFTPWLAQKENIALLAEAINLDLEVESVEEGVGLFRADIVCKDTVTGHRVLIENQLERTDHRHLGQLMTYAAGLGVVTIVWVASKFTEEHRAALDWLNEITNEDVNFFGLEIELWRIGESPYAPKFNIVSQPNDWIKSVLVRQTSSNDVSETKQLHLEYWAQFKAYVQENRRIPEISPRTPQPDHWYDFAIGRAGFHTCALRNARDGFIGVQLIISGVDAKIYYHLLHLDREAIEAELGTELEWNELPNKKRSDISLYQSNVKPNDRTKWEKYNKWLLEKLEAFYTVFAPRIKTLNIKDYVPDDSLEIDS